MSQHATRKMRRKERGASILLIVMAAFLLTAMAYGMFQLAMLLGGSRQVRNTTDAAVLNIARRITDVRVATQPAYTDVADSNGLIGVSNINRVWGKAYLISANIDEMAKNGQLGNGSAQGNGEVAYQVAKNINDELYDQVSSRDSHGQFFQEISVRRQASMINAGMGVDKSKVTSTTSAMVDRGDESNLIYNPSQLPAGATAAGVNKGGKSFLQGYSPFKANNKTFCFTSFHTGEMPHLIADNYFDQNRAEVNPIEGTTTAIPNAFRFSGEAGNGQVGVMATACAVANPMRQYSMAIPHSYITIFVTNQAVWYLDGKVVNVTTYTCKSGQPPQHGIVQKQGANGKKIDGFAQLGLEYSNGNTIMQIVNALPGDHTPAFSKMLQRVQEIDPTFTMARLQTLLQQAYDPAATRYYIFANYNTPDHSDPKVTIQPNTGSLPGWLAQTGPEGSPKLLMSENTQTDTPNYCWQEPAGKHHTEVSGSINWQPGTGFTQSLGELSINRRTDIYTSSSP